MLKWESIHSSFRPTTPSLSRAGPRAPPLRPMAWQLPPVAVEALPRSKELLAPSDAWLGGHHPGGTAERHHVARFDLDLFVRGTHRRHRRSGVDAGGCLQEGRHLLERPALARVVERRTG